MSSEPGAPAAFDLRRLGQCSARQPLLARSRRSALVQLRQVDDDSETGGLPHRLFRTRHPARRTPGADTSRTRQAGDPAGLRVYPADRLAGANRWQDSATPSIRSTTPSSVSSK